jgi:hypothetical protein
LQTKRSRWTGGLEPEVQNKSLLLKNIHKFYNNLDVPWVELHIIYTNGRISGNSVEGPFGGKII